MTELSVKAWGRGSVEELMDGEFLLECNNHMATNITPHTYLITVHYLQRLGQR